MRSWHGAMARARALIKAYGGRARVVGVQLADGEWFYYASSQQVRL